MEIKANYRFYDYWHKQTIVVPCVVVNETEKSYRIKLLAANVRGRKWGDFTWVSRDSVTFEKEPVDCTNAFWNND